jgi:hypothetical protein
MNSKKRDVRHGNDPLRNVPRWNVSSKGKEVNSDQSTTGQPIEPSSG